MISLLNPDACISIGSPDHKSSYRKGKGVLSMLHPPNGYLAGNNVQQSNRSPLQERTLQKAGGAAWLERVARSLRLQGPRSATSWTRLRACAWPAHSSPLRLLQQLSPSSVHHPCAAQCLHRQAPHLERQQQPVSSVMFPVGCVTCFPGLGENEQTISKFHHMPGQSDLHHRFLQPQHIYSKVLCYW